MEVSYKKDINHTYILFQGEKINTETFQVQMVLHNLAEGLLPSSILRIDQEEIWRCECTGLISLKEYCETRELKKDEFIWIVNQLMENIQELQDFLLDVNSLYLMPGEIYIHMPKRRILCCMIPFYQNDIWNSLKQTLQFLLQHLDSEDHEGATIAYNFFRVLSREDCSMELLWSILYEKHRKWKMTRDCVIGSERKEDSLRFNGEEANKKQNIFGIEPTKKQNVFGAETLKKENAFGTEISKKQNVFGTEASKKQNFGGGDTLQEEVFLEQSFWNKQKSRFFNQEKKKESPETDEEIDALMDELFFHKNEDKKYFWQDEFSWNFLKKMAYLFPSLLAIVVFLYLVFNSWTMTGVRLAFFAVCIVLLQAMGLILYFIWGRETNEINPLLDSQEKEVSFAFQNHDSEQWMKEEGTSFLDFVPKAAACLIRSDTKETYELRGKEILIGKSKEKAKVLIQEPAVSRVHALLTKKESGYYLQDMNSKNGTFVNGDRIPVHKEVLLKECDEIHFANICFHFQL